ncbi:MAG: hypothetical protein ACLGH3_01220 [Actinomycetota bacterium]
MRSIRFLLAALLLGMLAPVAAQADYPEECESPIRLLSGRGVLFDWGAVNCSYAQEPTLGSTSIVIPGGTQMVVRFNGAKPVDGISQMGTGSKVTYGQTTKYLRFEPATGADGNPLAGHWDASFSVGNVETVNAGEYLISVISPEGLEGADVTYERSYSTVA